MNKLITCTSVGVYEGALDRGRRYEVLAENLNNVRVRGDNDKIRWFPKYCFDLEGKPAPVLINWKFDDQIRDELSDWVEVSFELSDGSRRWCSFVTPEWLRFLLDQPNPEEGFCSPYMIIVSKLTTENVNQMLRKLDRDGELISASQVLDSSNLDDDEQEA